MTGSEEDHPSEPQPESLERFAEDMMDAADTLDLLAAQAAEKLVTMARAYADQIRARARAALASAKPDETD